MTHRIERRFILSTGEREGDGLRGSVQIECIHRVADTCSRAFRKPPVAEQGSATETRSEFVELTGTGTSETTDDGFALGQARGEFRGKEAIKGLGHRNPVQFLR